MKTLACVQMRPVPRDPTHLYVLQMSPCTEKRGLVGQAQCRSGMVTMCVVKGKEEGNLQLPLGQSADWPKSLAECGLKRIQCEGRAPLPSFCQLLLIRHFPLSSFASTRPEPPALDGPAPPCPGSKHEKEASLSRRLHMFVTKQCSLLLPAATLARLLQIAFLPCLFGWNSSSALLTL